MTSEQQTEQGLPQSAVRCTQFAWLARGKMAHGIGGLIMCMLVAVGCGQSQAQPWHELHDQAKMLYEQGQYAEAITVAQQALRVAQGTHGSQSTEVAASLRGLAILHEKQGHWTRADELSQEALTIWEARYTSAIYNMFVLLLERAQFAHDVGRTTEVKRLVAQAERLFEVLPKNWTGA